MEQDFYFLLVFVMEVMINRDSWEHSYFVVGGGFLTSTKGLPKSPINSRIHAKKIIQITDHASEIANFTFTRGRKYTVELKHVQKIELMVRF